MARQQGFIVQNKPIRGLITEQTALSFGDDACTEIWDCVLDDKGRVKRRKGFRAEVGGLATSIEDQTGDGIVYSEYVWRGPGGEANKKFLAQQIGKVVLFFDVSDDDTVSDDGPLGQVLNLDTFLAPFADETMDPGLQLCQYADGNKDLFVANPYCDPIAVSYDPITNALSFQRIVINIRDFEGLTDGIPDTFRPTSTIPNIKVSNPNFFYNLINGGWGQTVALQQWDNQRADLPSKADHPAFYRGGPNDPFNNDYVESKAPGTRLGKGGHFILRLNEANRAAALESEGHGNIAVQDLTSSPIEDGTPIGNSITAANAFDRNQSTIAAVTGNTVMILGKDMGPTESTKVLKVIVTPYHHANGRWHFFTSNSAIAPTSFGVTLYGGNSAPVGNGTNGVVLGTTGTLTEDNIDAGGLTNYPGGLVIISNDPITQYRYVWVRVVSAVSATIYTSEMLIYSGDDLSSPQKCNAMAFYAGRVFYGMNNKVLFSQIVENRDQYGRCYQSNDPTNEEISDLLPSDGGVISILEMGEVTSLFNSYNSLIAFANNGIWQISGSAGTGFRADDYTVTRLSSDGTDSAKSFINVRGVPVWWGDDGIMTLKYDPQFGNFSVVNVTAETIDTFIKDIPIVNRKYVKGVVDTSTKVALWLYSDDEDFNPDNPVYNKAIAMNINTQAFYPWTVPSNDSYQIVGVVSINPIVSNPGSVFKFVTRTEIGAAVDTFNVLYSEPTNSTYKDWTGAQEQDYQSYFITGYKLDGDAQRDIQLNYITVFMEVEATSNAFIQGIFDFAINGNSGRWSTSQSCYDQAPSNANMSMRKLKIRGRGKAIQLKFKSETGRPFNIVGWGIWESGNAGI